MCIPPFLFRFMVAVLAIFAFSSSLSFSERLPSSAPVESKAQLTSTVSEAVPGTSFTVYLQLTHPPDWHSYYLNNAVPLNVIPTLQWKAQEGVSFSAINYPVPESYEQYGVTSYVYHREVFFPVVVTLSSELSPERVLRLEATADWQICKESCLPESAVLSLELPVVPKETNPQASAPGAVSGVFPAREHPFEVRAALTASNLEITLPAGAPEDLFFYDFDGITDLEADQIREGRLLTIARDAGNLFRDDPRVPGTALRGIITSSSSALTAQGDRAVWIESPFVRVEALAQADSTQAGSPEQGLLSPASPFDYSDEELAALYNPDEPIAYQTLKKSVPMTFWFALGGAFVGGILLNLMPCVFPVLGLKVMSFVEQAGQDPWKIRLHGLIFTLGVLVSMWILAGFLLVLKHTAGESINWGQQMGDPRFVGGIVIILFLFGLNMAGVFELGTRLTSVGGNRSSKGYTGSFFNGVLTTVIATPCSGPFLGAAMGYTLDQVVPVALFIFTIFALGISFPYLVLSFFPALTSKMPRPGAWMGTLKTLLSFALFAAAAFFLRSFASQTGWEGTSALIFALVVLALGAYTYGHWTLPHLKKSVRYGLGFGLSALIVSGGLFLSWQAATSYEAPLAQRTSPSASQKTAVQWEPWRPGLVEKLRQEGHYVWVDYTAQWCMTCLFNKSRIFSDQEVLEAFAQREVIFVKADLTERSPVLAKDLSRVDRVQIPVNLFYSPRPSDPALLLEELISPQDVLEALRRLP